MTYLPTSRNLIVIVTINALRATHPTMRGAALLHTALRILRVA